MPIIASSAYNGARVITDLVRSLLNDAGYPGLPLPLAAISRAVVASIPTVTVTTQGAHGLVLTDQVIIDSVVDSGFDGTFLVSAVLSSVQYQYQQAGAATSSSGGYSTGVGLGNVFTDPVLMPFLNSAYRVVQRALAMSGQTTFKTDNYHFLVPGVYNPFAADVFPNGPDPSVQIAVNDSTAPPNNLPVDLIEPLELWERPCTCTTDVTQPLILAEPPVENFTQMTDLTNSDGLPSLIQTQQMGLWEWRADGIYMLGCLQDVQIRMRYRKSLPVLSDGTSQLLIRNSEECIAYIAAALAANSRGSSLADKYDQAGEDALEKLKNAATRQQQQIVRRRRPYRARRGLRSGYFF